MRITFAAWSTDSPDESVSSPPPGRLTTSGMFVIGWSLIEASCPRCAQRNTHLGRREAPVTRHEVIRTGLGGVAERRRIDGGAHGGTQTGSSRLAPRRPQPVLGAHR